jgi:hypothetical protein
MSDQFQVFFTQKFMAALFAFQLSGKTGSILKKLATGIKPREER